MSTALGNMLVLDVKLGGQRGPHTLIWLEEWNRYRDMALVHAAERQADAAERQATALEVLVGRVG